MLNQKQNNIEEIAYYLWLSEGKPEGQSKRHWEMASRMIEEEQHTGKKPKRSTDPSEAKGAYEPAQPDQT